MPPIHAKSPRERGFTLIEMLIVAPMVILLIAGIIAYITTLTGDSLKMKEKNATSYSIQEALNRMEEDASRSTAFITTTGTVNSPQGQNDGSSAFTYATNGTLILQAPALSANPFDTSRQIVYKNTPNACTNKASNDIVYYSTVYFLRGTDLWRRVIVDRNPTGKCDTPWQRPTCTAVPTNISPTSPCQAKDEKILTNVTTFSTTYYQGETALSPNPPVSDPATPISANTVDVNLTTTQNIANQTVEAKGNLRITSSNR